jgi:hypothetical protein
MRYDTLGQWDSDSEPDAAVVKPERAVVKPDPRADRLAALRAVSLVPGGNPGHGAVRKGVVLLTIDYGYHLPAIGAARRVLAALKTVPEVGWALCHEVDLTADPAAEVARYNPTGALMYPTFFVMGDDGLYEYQGKLDAPALLAALKLAFQSRVPRTACLGQTAAPRSERPAEAPASTTRRLVALGVPKTARRMAPL